VERQDVHGIFDACQGDVIDHVASRPDHEQVAESLIEDDLGGGTRESEQPTITAIGSCPWINVCCRSDEQFGWMQDPAA